MDLRYESSDRVSSEEVSQAGIRPRNIYRPRAESSSLATSYPNSLSQRTPARSYYQRTYTDHIVPDDNSVHVSQSVRQETAELASWALSDAASTRDGSPQYRHESGFSGLQLPQERNSLSSSQVNGFEISSHARPEPIDEASETSPENILQNRLHPVSTLTKLIRQSSQAMTDNASGDSIINDMSNHRDIHVVTVGNGIISQPHEDSSLLQSLPGGMLERPRAYGALQDVESQQIKRRTSSKPLRHKILQNQRKFWESNRKALCVFFKENLTWASIVVEPASYLPAVVLGLLLNVLDALSYGMILFPLSQSVFSDLGPDGISIFYVSCIVSQLVYSLGGSIFKGGVGSEMIEVVPFFHQMAFTILARVGEENADSVLATTILAYSMSSVLTGAIFYIMGWCNLGSLIGFFPRHILIGCIGGVGWFLITTGIEVSARLQGNLEYNMKTLQKLFHLDTIFLWTTPLLLSILLILVKRWVKHPLLDATYFISLIGIFHFLVAALSNLDLESLRTKGWIFEAPAKDAPFYHFYTLYNFRAVDWSALAATVPAMFALTFFGILHIPINIPALALTIGEDNVNVDRELKAHGWSNALSGFCGSVQNYLVYTNTVLFMRNGGDRIAGVLLAAATFGILVVGLKIVGFIPITVVASLIYFLGIDLMKEAMWDTFGRVHKLEYLTILVIVVTMGAWDFVAGILIGIVLACVSFVLQTSQISAIRTALPGGIASSTVRRHPIQQRFLQRAGPQIHVMKLAGYLFFGTIVGVEKRIRALLDEEAFRTQPIRFLIIDLSNVDGVDFSAAEAFTRVNRIFSTRGIDMIVSGTNIQSEVGRSLSNVDLWNEENGVEFCEDLNSALEHCENELLKTFYRKRDSQSEAVSSTVRRLDVPLLSRSSFSAETLQSSPCRNQLEAVATSALQEHDMVMPLPQIEGLGQPLHLMMQTFSTVSDRDMDFWRPTVEYFRREEFAKATTLYTRGDNPRAFYLLESGILRADYTLPHGKFSELILAGTTCGELPFFSQTPRTSTTVTETDCIVWMLDNHNWESLQRDHPNIAQEFLKISLKLTSERMDAITRYMLLTSS